MVVAAVGVLAVQFQGMLGRSALRARTCSTARFFHVSGISNSIASAISSESQAAPLPINTVNSISSFTGNPQKSALLDSFLSNDLEAFRTAHSGSLPVIFHPLYSAPQLAPGHRFPMQVFQRIHDRLLASGAIQPSQVYHPSALPCDDILGLVHCPEYLLNFSSGSLDPVRVRRIGLGDITQTLVERTKSEVSGTLLTALIALEVGLACNTAGGTHHAHHNFGSGFCILNDLAFTAHFLLATGKASRVLILDLDVHQGDGTAAMCHATPGIFTVSVHCESNFPTRKQSSSVDMGLRDGVEDDEYLGMLGEGLVSWLDRFKPDVVLYDAGVDVHKDDKLGRLALTDEGMWRREMMVLDTCVGWGVPVAGNVGGGYAEELDVLADRHCLLHRAALQVWRDHEL